MFAGKGSYFIKSFSDINYNQKMNFFQSREFVVRGISLAMINYGNTGGIIKFCTISNKGIKKEIILPILKLDKSLFFKKIKIF